MVLSLKDLLSSPKPTITDTGDEMQEEGLALGGTCYPQHCAHLATAFISFLYIKFQVTQPEVKTTHPPLGCSWCSAGKWGLNLSPWPKHSVSENVGVVLSRPQLENTTRSSKPGFIP